MQALPLATSRSDNIIVSDFVRSEGVLDESKDTHYLNVQCM